MLDFLCGYLCNNYYLKFNIKSNTLYNLKLSIAKLINHGLMVNMQGIVRGMFDRIKPWKQ